MRLLPGSAGPVRRRKFAKTLVIGAALVTVGLAYTVLVPRSATGADGPQSDQIDAGRRLFAVGCSSCHGIHAEGGTNGAGRVAGPSLIGVRFSSTPPISIAPRRLAGGLRLKGLFP